MGTFEENETENNTNKKRIFYVMLAAMVLLVVGFIALFNTFKPNAAAVSKPVVDSSNVIVVDPVKAGADLSKIVDASISKVEAGNVLENRAPFINNTTDLNMQSVNFYNPKQGAQVCVYNKTGESCPESKPYIYALQDLLKKDDTTVLPTDKNVYLVQNPTDDVAVIVTVTDYFRVTTGLYSKAQIINFNYNVDAGTVQKITEFASK